MTLIPSLKALAVQSIVESNPSAEPTYLSTEPGPTLSALGATFTLRQWFVLKANAPHGIINIRKIMDKVEASFRTPSVLPEGAEVHIGFQYLTQQSNLPSNLKVNLLFHRLAELLQEKLAEAHVSLDFRIPTSHEELARFQRLASEYEERNALMVIWTAHIGNLFIFPLEERPKTYDEIRTWLCNPENAPRLNAVTALNLDGLGIKALPSEIRCFGNLRRLILGDNNLRHVPDWIGDLRSLQQLDLSENRLSHIPNSIGSLPNLTELFLDNNELCAVPSSIGTLTNLTCLDLSNNQLSSLPTMLEGLGNLTILYLSTNKLRQLPKELCQLSSLNELHLNENELAHLPESFGELVNLVNLDLSSNRLETLPASFTQLSLLEELNLSNNRFTTFSPSTLDFWPGAKIDILKNPLLFISDQKLKCNPSLQVLKDHLKASLDYDCQTPLAGLLQAMIGQRSVDELRFSFNSLPEETRDRICQAVQGSVYTAPAPTSSSSSTPVEPTSSILFSDRGLFSQWVKKVINDTFLAMPTEMKRRVYGTVTRLKKIEEIRTSSFPHKQHSVFLHAVTHQRPPRASVRKETPLAFDHMLRFADAVALTISNTSLETARTKRQRTQ